MQHVEHDEATGTVAVHTPSSTYAFRVEDSGAVRHVHWGAPLPVEACATLPAWSSYTDSFAGSGDGGEEYPVPSGARFSRPSLLVEWPDGDAVVEPVPRRVEVGGDAVVVHLVDRVRPLAIALHLRVRPGTDVLERWAELRHTGPADADPVTVLRADTARWVLPWWPDYRRTVVHGGWAREGAVERTRVAPGESATTSRRGHAGHDAAPWVVLDDGTATEEHGEVVAVALAASGSWRVVVERGTEGRCGVAAGAQGARTVLAPGQVLRTPSSFALFTARGFGGASRQVHRFVRDHVLPHGEELRPVLYNAWEAVAFDVDEANQLALARTAARIGVQLFVVDDGWFAGRRDDTAGLGDWWPDPVKFPRGLRPLADEVHALGMAFGLWVEPEMVNPDSDLHRRHPDWVVHTPGRERTQRRNQLVLDFGRPEVVEWAVDWLVRTVADADVDFLKWDLNRSLTEAPHTAHAAHAAGVLHVLDALRARFPALRIEACAGGGGRADLATLARTDQVWTSDNTDPVDRIRIQHGWGQVLPAAAMSCWVADSPNAYADRETPLRFRFHVAAAGGALGIGLDLTRLDDAGLDEVARLVAEYRRLQPVVAHGDLHRLRGPEPGPTTVVQYVTPDRDRSVVLAWRPRAPFGHLERPVRLRGLDPTADYRDEDTGRVHPAALLSGAGLDLALPAAEWASRVVRLRREP